MGHFHLPAADQRPLVAGQVLDEVLFPFPVDFAVASGEGLFQREGQGGGVAGGSYGGIGGGYQGALLNPVYGDLTNPVDPGSGGGRVSVRYSTYDY